MDRRRGGGEFDVIRRCFAPLAAGNALAFDLTDDAAALRPRPGRDLILTADAMVAGVHFLPGDPPEAVAAKLLRVNLSDLAAMGAEGIGYLLTTAWPRDLEIGWIERFARGLAADQQRFGVSLLGGDTVSIDGPMALSLTAVGDVPSGRALRRGGARPGDAVFVSGTIGDGALGLKALRGELPELPAEAVAFLSERYRLPSPRVTLGPRLLDLATACIDVSDGLVADLEHIAAASSAAARLEGLPPLSPAARAALAREAGLLQAILGGGDDYELLFTAPPARSGAIEAAAAAAGVAVTRIGAVEAGSGVRVLDTQGRPVALDVRGWRHF